MREKSGIALCEKYLGVHSIQVLDPTMLLEAHDYLSNIDCSKYIGTHKNSIMCYVLDETYETELLIQYASKQLCLIPNKCNVQVDNKQLSLKDRIQPPVEKWLAGFVDADFIITDSFHACIFSILFKKQFIVVGNKERGNSRILSLLSMFRLDDRLLRECNSKEFDDVLRFPINWKFVYERLNRWRIKSLDYLKNSLG